MSLVTSLNTLSYDFCIFVFLMRNYPQGKLLFIVYVLVVYPAARRRHSVGCRPITFGIYNLIFSVISYLIKDIKVSCLQIVLFFFAIMVIKVHKQNCGPTLNHMGIKLM